MPAIDERLRADLERLADPPDTSGVFERLTIRRERRARARRVRAGVLAVAVAAITATWIAMATAPSREDTFGNTTGDLGSGGFVGTCSDGYGTHLCHVSRSAMQDGVAGDDLVHITDEELEIVSMPAVSSGGSVVFDRSDPVGGTTSLWTVDVDGHDLHRLSSPGSGLTNASWGPDGSLVAVASSGTPGDGSAALAILDPVLAPDPVVRTIPLQGLVFPSTPRFSPDGTQIMFTAGRDANSTETNVYTVNADGTELVRRTRSVAWTPDWSPDGTRIVFGAATGSGEELFVCPIDCSSPRRIEDPSGRPVDGGLPRWSPHGGWISFQTVEEDGDTVTRVVRVDGTETRTLATRVGEVVWIPDFTANDRPGAVGMDVGLGFNLCHVQVDRGLDLVGYRKPATVWTGSRVIPYQGCIDGPEGEGYLAVDVLDGRGADFSAGPLSCDPGCAVIATPDFDGDGDREIVLGSFVFVPTAPGRAWVYDVRLSEAGSGLFRVERPDGHPWVVTWGAGGAGSWEAGTTCPDPGTVDVWRAESPDAGSTWVVRSTTYQLKDLGGRLVAIPTSRSDGTDLPNATRLCGEDVPIGG